MFFLTSLTASLGQFRKQFLHPAHNLMSMLAFVVFLDLLFLGERLPSGSQTAPLTQVAKHVPHSVQKSGSISNRFLTSPEMAFSGHFLAQAPHPIQSWLMLYDINQIL